MRSWTLRLIIVALTLGPTLASSPAWASEFGAIRRNNDGARKLSKGQSVEAYDQFTQALTDLPFSGDVHYNIATTFLTNQEFEKAINEYAQAMKLAKGETDHDKSVRFYSLFNSAVAMTELKKTDEALELYQQALEIKPDSVETKTNMELLSANGGGGQGGDDKDDKQDQNKDQKGNGKDQKDSKDGKDDKKDQKPQQGQNQDQQKEKQKPKPFKSEDLTQQDVNKILEELKNQEERVRAEMNHEGPKDVSPEKDW
jgi:tetratricopeptide (TPR) repeat protein